MQHEQLQLESSLVHDGERVNGGKRLTQKHESRLQDQRTTDFQAALVRGQRLCRRLGGISTDIGLDFLQVGAEMNWPQE